MLIQTFDSTFQVQTLFETTLDTCLVRKHLKNFLKHTVANVVSTRSWLNSPSNALASTAVRTQPQCVTPSTGLQLNVNTGSSFTALVGFLGDRSRAAAGRNNDRENLVEICRRRVCIFAVNLNEDCYQRITKRSHAMMDHDVSQLQ